MKQLPPKEANLRDVLKSPDNWLFLCFTSEARGTLQSMLGTLRQTGGWNGRIGLTEIPAGVLWNGEACLLSIIRRDALPSKALRSALRDFFGYENPDASANLFTLGVTPEDDEALSRVGLFGRPQ